MCLPLAVPGGENPVRQAGRQSLGEVPPVVCWLCQWPARTPPPTMAPLFLVARQFGGGSSVTHAPLNRGPINPLGDEDQVKAPGSYLACWFFFFFPCWRRAA